MNKSFKIPVTKLYFDNNEEEEVVKVLRSGWVLQGPKVEEFEKKVASYVGVEYGVATTSCTTALFLALQVWGIGPGDEVIVPSFSFIASANVIVHVGATVVFADIDPRTYNIDPADIERKISPRTKAIIAVDQVGLPCDMDKIKEIAKRHNLYILEDAACSLGSEINGKKVGSFADIACFSFHPRKVISTGEGGMIVTNNQKWQELARTLRNHGAVYSKEGETFPVIGYNLRLTDIQAALGIAQMRKLEEILTKRAYLAQRYNEAFSQIEKISTPFVPDGYKHNFQSYILRVNGSSRKQRDDVVEKLAQNGIVAKKGIQAAHLETAYLEKIGRVNLPNTESAYDQTIIIPLYFSMTNEEQDFVIEEVIREVEAI